MDKPVRKALETPLVDAALHAQLLARIPDDLKVGFDDPDRVPIQWPNYSWPDEQSRPLVYLRPDFGAGEPVIRELGRQARKDVPGDFVIGIFVPAGVGLDLPDDLADIVVGAYPYASELTTDAGTVEITKTAKRKGMGVNSRYFTPVHINWTLWRAR